MEQKTYHTKNWRHLDDKDRLKASAHMAKRGAPIDSFGDDKTSQLRLRNEARRAANDLTQELQHLLNTNPGDKWTSALQARYDNDTGIINSLGLLVNSCENALLRLGMAEEANVSGQSLNWRDGHGDNVRVLSRHEKLTDTSDAHRDSFGFGSFIRAMVAGTNHPGIRAALSEGTDSAGGYTVPKYLLQQLIDAMRARTVCIQAGALTVPLDGASNTIVRVASDPVAGWRLENADVAESDPTFEGVVLAPKSLAVLVKASRELLDDSMNLEQALMQAFAGSLAAEVDRVCLVGSGSAPEPRGIFNTSGINVVSMGTNGAALTNHGKLLDALYELELDNAPPPGAMVMHPRTKRVIAGFADTTNQPLQIPPALSGIGQMVTTNMPINQTQGSASNASSIIMGDFSQLLLGVRQELRIEVLRETFASKLQYAFLAHLRFDVAVAQPAAFCAIKGIIPA